MRHLRWHRVLAAAALLTLAACTAPLGAPVLDAMPGLRAGTPEGQEARVVVIAVANPVATLPRMAGSTPLLYARQPHYVAGGDALKRLADVARDHGLTPLSSWPIDAIGVHCATLLIPAGARRDTVLAALQRDPRVELAQALNLFETLDSPRALQVPPRSTLPVPAAPAYDDPYLPLQHSLRLLGVLDAHRCTRGKGTRVAVIDTGIDVAHPDFQRLALTTANFVDRDDARFARDTHGTEVAGLIGAQPGNARGIVGIAPEVHLLALKACWERSDGRAVCNSFSLAQALAAAIDHRAQVINLSLGGPPDELLTRLVRAAQARGAIVVGARPTASEHGGFPTGISGVIAVGHAGDGGEGDIAAPAREVLTLTPGGRYDFANGSSLAAAQLSAITALLLERRPNLDPVALTHALHRGSGGGLVHACRSLASVDASCLCPP
jgi:subtilisin family serine protease